MEVEGKNEPLLVTGSRARTRERHGHLMDELVKYLPKAIVISVLLSYDVAFLMVSPWDAAKQEELASKPSFNAITGKAGTGKTEAVVRLVRFLPNLRPRFLSVFCDELHRFQYEQRLPGARLYSPKTHQTPGVLDRWLDKLQRFRTWLSERAPTSSSSFPSRQVVVVDVGDTDDLVSDAAVRRLAKEHVELNVTVFYVTQFFTMCPLRGMSRWVDRVVTPVTSTVDPSVGCLPAAITCVPRPPGRVARSGGRVTNGEFLDVQSAVQAAFGPYSLVILSKPFSDDLGQQCRLYYLPPTTIGGENMSLSSEYDSMDENEEPDSDAERRGKVFWS